MARRSTKVAAHKWSGNAGADGRPTKKAKAKGLRDMMTSDQDRVTQMGAANERRREERKETENYRRIIVALCVDVEDKPPDRHNAVTQTTNGFCSDLETVVIMVDRYIMATTV